MLKKAFYILKPFIPRSLQLYLRRKLLIFKIKKYNNIWPILRGSEKRPSNWENWPDNKKFALILTHDVEHQRGYDRILELMNIEKELGYVSSFNLIPERDYLVDRSLLKRLVENGFEYGIHGLRHDGKLFSSKKEFMNRAKRINYYLNEWGAIGFRAPAMQHNLRMAWSIRH